MKRETKDTLIVWAIYFLLAMMVILAITFFSNIKLLNSNPCDACEELLGETCVPLEIKGYEEPFIFDDTKPKEPELEVNIQNE